MKTPALTALLVSLTLAWPLAADAARKSKSAKLAASQTSSGSVDREPAVEGASQIREVALFKDRAFVTRAKSVEHSAGAVTVVFTGITPLADHDSLKVQVAQGRTLKILGIRTRSEYTLKSRNSELDRLKEKRQELAQARDRTSERVGVLAAEKQNLESLADHYRDSFTLNLHQNTWSKDGFRSFLNLWSNRSASMNGSWFKAYQEFWEVGKQLEEVDAKLAQLASASDRQTLTVLVDATSTEKGHADVSIQYLVPHAGWGPAYDLRVESKRGKAGLEAFAYAHQETGEDWTDVKLSLSNVRSELKPELPSIEPYTLSYREVKKVQTSVVGKQEDKIALTVGADGGAAASSESEEVDEGQKGLARTFAIAGKQTLKNGMSRIKIFIARGDAPYSERLELVAAQYPRVYKRGKLTNPFNWNLASGPLNIYYDGSFLQQNWLEAVAKGNHFAINAGVDHNLVVTRWHNDKAQPATVLSTQKHVVREYFTHIQNFNDTGRSIKLMEQVPVSEIKNVEVKITETKGKSPKKDSENEGWVYWDLSLEPLSKETLQVSLDVAVPKDFQFSW